MSVLPCFKTHILRVTSARWHTRNLQAPILPQKQFSNKLQTDYNNFIKALKTTQRSTATNQSPNQEKGCSKWLKGCVVSICFCHPFPALRRSREEGARFLVPSLAPHQKSRTHLQCSNLSVCYLALCQKKKKRFVSP